jgi:Spy/CpxP family protein refolding chaperone
MYLFRNKFLMGAAIALIGTMSLFAQPAKHAQGQKRMRVMKTVLNLTPAQVGQARAIFREANLSVKPLRQQLQETRKQIHTAVLAGDERQIQQLAATEGSQQGQIAAIRATSMSKVYKMLTPEQQQKFTALQEAMKGGKG